MVQTDMPDSPSEIPGTTRGAGLDSRPRISHVTVADLYQRAYREYGRRAAVVSDQGELTYAALGERVQNIIGGLRDLGLRPGDRGVILLDNCPEFFEVDQALFVGGYVRCAISVRLHEREVLHILRDCGASVVFASPDWADRLAGLRDQLPQLRYVVTVLGGKGDASLDALRTATPPASPACPAPMDPAAILYTSGTTGVPKGATLSHTNWMTMVRNSMLELPPGDADVVLHVAPLSHLSGYVAPTYFARGATHLTSSKFDAGRTLDLIRDRAVTVLPTVPTMLNLLVMAADSRAERYTSLRTVVYAGSPIAPDRLLRAQEIFGEVFVQFYGLSETPMPLTCLSARDHAAAARAGDAARLSSAGRVCPFVEVRLVDEAGHDVEPGHVGEVTVRGDQVMMGYWGRPTDTAEMVDAEGWARTGDLGRMDPEGYLTIVDRKKDMVVTGGFNVYPTEVENAIFSLPGVAEVAVVGVPDSVWGEALKAVVVRRDGHELTEADVVAACTAQLAAYKKPRSVEFVEELPKTTSGKIMRRQLRELYWQGTDRLVGG
ncbi:class I adenylate-forming enzyme family protein [Streptomyces sp. KR55]|uniref:class I adenylate-forming enzyme family protein n=1 Tax=Streptomyces sp. KR55 TaxID=3457425 RepID=UPI003FD54AFB